MTLELDLHKSLRAERGTKRLYLFILSTRGILCIYAKREGYCAAKSTLKNYSS